MFVSGENEAKKKSGDYNQKYHRGLPGNGENDEQKEADTESN